MYEEHFSFLCLDRWQAAHIRDAWSIKVAKEMSRWDSPPQSCVLRVIWTCVKENAQSRESMQIWMRLRQNTTRQKALPPFVMESLQVKHQHKVSPGKVSFNVLTKPDGVQQETLQV